MIAKALNWLAGGHSHGAGGVQQIIEQDTTALDYFGLGAPPLTQLGEEFPALPVPASMPHYDAIVLDRLLTQAGLSPPPVVDLPSVPVCTAAAATTAALYGFWPRLPRGNPPAWRSFSVEPTFGWSRTAVTGGSTSTPGSTVTNAVRALAKFGLVPAALLPGFNLARFDGARCDRWANIGVPARLADFARLWPVDIYHARGARAIEWALYLRCGLVFSCGFTFTKTDRDGVAIREDLSGKGGHALAIIGAIRNGPGGSPHVAVAQSYGTRIFLFNGSRQHPLWPRPGVGLVPLDWLADHLTRRVCYAIFPKGSKVT